MRWGPVAVALVLVGASLAGSGTTAAQVPADAAAVLVVLRGQGLPIGESITYTAESDPNSQLGRPGQYSSKASFRDTRLADRVTAAEPNVDSGGSIETFPTTAAAERREEYIRGITERLPIVNEYTLREGVVLLRLSHYLTPTQAAEYEAVLRTLR